MKLSNKLIQILLCTLFISHQLQASNDFVLTERVGKQVGKAFELYELGKIDQTLLMIEKIHPRSDFDKAYLKRFQGNLQWEKGRQQQALNSLEIAVNLKALAPLEQRQSERMLADLYLNQQQTDDAIRLYQHLIAEEPSEDLYKHLALSYYQKNSWQAVVDATRNGVVLSQAFNQSLHILQLSGLFELKDYQNANLTLQKLTEHDPENKRWWMQLISTYQLLGRSENALATYEQAYQLGFINSSNEIKQLANFRASLGAPYQAAQLLQSAISDKRVPENAKNYQQLAMFWQVAREHDKAQYYWGKSASLSGDAKHYLTQAQLLQLLGRYEQMLAVLSAIKAEDDSLKGQVAFAKVQGLFALKRYQKAKLVAQQLVNDPDNNERATQWVKLLNSRQADAKQFAL